MHAVDLIYSAIKDKSPTTSRKKLIEYPENTKRAHCALTGAETDCIPTKKLLSASFTNWDIMANPTGKYIGVATYYALQYRNERMACWICDGNQFAVIKRPQIRELILDGVKAHGYNSSHWSMYITTSYKKHGALWSPVNSGERGFVRFEMLTVDCRDDDKIADWYGKMLHWLEIGVYRTCFEQGYLWPSAIDKIGLKEAVTFERWIADKAHDPLYKLLIYILPTQEELKNGEYRT